MKRKLGLMVSCILVAMMMCTTVFAAEADKNISADVFDGRVESTSDNLFSAEVNDLADEQVMTLSTSYVDASKTIYRSSSSNGVFYGNYRYTWGSSTNDTAYLVLEMPNNSGSDYLQGTITIIGSNGDTLSTTISNYTSSTKTITYSGLENGVTYYFYYQMYSVGTSGVGYLTATFVA